MSGKPAMIRLPEGARTCRRIVETTGPRMFGLEESEVQERRRYVAYVRKEVEVRFSLPLNEL